MRRTVWRKMSDYVSDFVADYVAENGGKCRTVWRKMADFVGLCGRLCGGLWRKMADFVERMASLLTTPSTSFGAPAQMGYNESCPLCEGIIDLYSTEGY